MNMFKALCKCGWRSEPVYGSVMAEVLGNAHEASRVQRPHAHDTVVVKEEK